jgi:hypothetical protein
MLFQVMKSRPGPPMTLGNAVAARVRLIVWCKACVVNLALGIVAETIVESALGPDWQCCSDDWLGWDFEHCDKKTLLEVKQPSLQRGGG